MCAGPQWYSSNGNSPNRNGFFVAGDNLVGQMICGRRAPSAFGERGLLLLLVVFVSDDFYTARKCGESVHVVAITMGQDHRTDRLRCYLRDRIQQFFAAGRRRLGIDHNDFVRTDDHA